MSRTRRSIGSKRDGATPRDLNAEALTRRAGQGFHTSKRRRLEDEEQERLMHDLSGLSGEEIPWEQIDYEYDAPEQCLDCDCAKAECQCFVCESCGEWEGECVCQNT